MKLLRHVALGLLLLGLGVVGAVYHYDHRLQAFYTTPSRATATWARMRVVSPTEVFVLGTVHFPTSAFTADSLYDALEAIGPDVVLFEIDSTRLAEVVLRPPALRQRVGWALGWEAPPIEAAAVTKYRHFHPATLVRPYEWGRRDQFHRQHGILSTPGRVFKKLYALREATRLTPRQQRVLATYDSLTARLNELASTQPLAALNSATADSLAQRRQNCQYHQLKTIVDENAALGEFRAFYQINEQYWAIRNQAMAHNIARYVALYPGRRLVVLCGFNHRYYLRQELRANEKKLRFRLRELADLAPSAR